MCSQSVIMDYGQKDFAKYIQSIPPSQPAAQIVSPPPAPAVPPSHIAAFEELLRKAKEYDRITGQPDCELDSKREAIRKIAAQLGVTIAFP